MEYEMNRQLTLMCLLFVAAAGAGFPVLVTAQETYRLASVQVVAASERPPALKLSANGPIAFAPLPADESGVPAGPHRLVARLYGVTPGDLGSLNGLAPFAVSAVASGSDTLLTVSAGSLPPDATLQLRAGMRSNELQVVISRVAP
jgi:hypothetical protein